jgi:hypothetical protein
VEVHEPAQRRVRVGFVGQRGGVRVPPRQGVKAVPAGRVLAQQVVVDEFLQQSFGLGDLDVDQRRGGGRVEIRAGVAAE